MRDAALIFAYIGLGILAVIAFFQMKKITKFEGLLEGLVAMNKNSTSDDVTSEPPTTRRINGNHVWEDFKENVKQIKIQLDLDTPPVA